MFEQWRLARVVTKFRGAAEDEATDLRRIWRGIRTPAPAEGSCLLWDGDGNGGTDAMAAGSGGGGAKRRLLAAPSVTDALLTVKFGKPKITIGLESVSTSKF